MPKISQPKLVNRGAAGLLTKLPKSITTEAVKETANGIAAAIDNGTPDKILVNSENVVIIAIDQLVPDPNNARLHPERNLESIRESLKQYGQVKPLVVRKETMVIVAGNGTYEAAKSLGWTKVSANLVDMDAVSAIGYGLADNRTAELAKWDFEIVARLDKLLQEAKQCPVGWSKDELEVLRTSDWTPPTVTEGNGNGEAQSEATLLVGFTPDQYEVIQQIITDYRNDSNDQELDPADCIWAICWEWLQKKESINA